MALLREPVGYHLNSVIAFGQTAGRNEIHRYFLPGPERNRERAEDSEGCMSGVRDRWQVWQL